MPAAPLRSSPYLRGSPYLAESDSPAFPAALRSCAPTFPAVWRASPRGAGGELLPPLQGGHPHTHEDFAWTTRAHDRCSSSRADGRPNEWTVDGPGCAGAAAAAPDPAALAAAVREVIEAELDTAGWSRPRPHAFTAIKG